MNVRTDERDLVMLFICQVDAYGEAFRAFHREIRKLHAEMLGTVTRLRRAQDPKLRALADEAWPVLDTGARAWLRALSKLSPRLREVNDLRVE